MSDDKLVNRFGVFLERLTDQLQKLEKTLDDQHSRQGGSGWSMGWKFSLGGTGDQRPSPGPPVEVGPAPSAPTKPSRGRPIPVEPRALAFFEVHEKQDQLLVIVDLPGLAEDAIEASMAADDLLVITVDARGQRDRREILLPSPLVDLEVSRVATITTIRCHLEKS